MFLLGTNTNEKSCIVVYRYFSSFSCRTRFKCLSHTQQMSHTQCKSYRHISELCNMLTLVHYCYLLIRNAVTTLMMLYNVLIYMNSLIGYHIHMIQTHSWQDNLMRYHALLLYCSYCVLFVWLILVVCLP